ncbi:MAG: T9SS type A sorting domain-containing protein [bacterium]|nr:T9SS type A sorting domain-containing protein [bacterium]
MKYLLLSILVVFELGRLSAQSFIGKLNPFPATNQTITAADDTLKILAIMVNFQEDADGTTFGNGKFGTIYSQNYGSDILDPLPHDKKYFESHLLFVKNYFAKVSKGKLEIEYTVLPDTFSVSDRMRNYSPDPGSDDFTNIADFAVEAWTKADQVYPGFNFSDYDVFLIFHAGVGRDISLPGSIGNERDLPSLYLSDNAFKEIYGNNFEGIPVSGGSFKITNSMIIPETESREVQTISGTFLFEITINGLLCASVGSHLGLPDLFDTETGLSAIGRFGLMDGQSIFAYLGTYPPEPSPWEKIRLGWAEPVTMEIQNADVSLVTNLAASISDTIILKVPLNSSEYYLIENRIRDAYNDGSTISYAVGDLVRTKTFPNDTTGYRSFDVDSLSGVIVDVDEFDWAVPGNGIVIWHIDENVINEKIADNKVNTDKTRRGVDVEEADGVQDIGEVFYTIFGDQVIGEGFEEDFWYADNPSELFENRFAKDTRPNTLTNTGANSLITIKDFSEIDNRMSFRVEFGDSIIKPLYSFKFPSAPTQAFAGKLSSIVFNDEVYFIAVDDNYTLYVIRGDSLIYKSSEYFSIGKPAVTIFNNVLYIFCPELGELNFWMTDGSINNTGQLIVPPILSNCVINTKLSGEKELWFGSWTGSIYKYSLGSLPNVAPELKDSIYFGNYNINHLAVHEDFYAITCTPKIPPADTKIYISSSGSLLIMDDFVQDLALTKDRDGNIIALLLTQKFTPPIHMGRLYVIQGSNILNVVEYSGDHIPLTFSLSDLKRDGNVYILTSNKSIVEANNFEGTMADNFPFQFNSEYRGTTPISADFEGDNRPEIVFATNEGDIYAIDGGSGKLIPGFPISLGHAYSTLSFFNLNGKVNLVAANYDGLLQAWSISSAEGEIIWKEQFANSENTSFIDAAENTNRINEFFPANRAYNYPNPVCEGTTNIRYYVSEDSKINIKIFDLAGDFVAELNDEAQGGMDNETVWNVGDIQSGVYLARIEAVCDCGKTEQAVIKIAVVK